MSTPNGTRNRRMLKAIQDLLEGKMNKDVQSYTIGGRSLTMMSLAELRQYEADYTRRCLNETRKTFFPQITFTQ